MLINNVKTGDRIEITLANAHKDSDLKYISKVEAVLDKHKVMIHAPTENGRSIKLDKREKYSLVFLSASGMSRFEGTVEDYLLVDGFSITAMKLKPPGERIQRRDFFRFSCLIPVKFALIDDDDPTAESEQRDGTIRDISGGGLRIISKTPVEDNSVIRMTFQLDDEFIMAFGQVLLIPNAPKSATEFQFAVKFFGMSNTEQEKIVQFIYSQQRKMLQKPR